MPDPLTMIEHLHDYGQGLTDWELEFLDRLEDRLAYCKKLTRKQQAWLEELYLEKG